MSKKQYAPVQGEYTRVGQWTKNPELLEKAYFTPITEDEAEWLVKYYVPAADVLFYPDIRSEAVDNAGTRYIRLCNNPLSIADIEAKINYPRLTLGVVLHETAHLLAGVWHSHGWKFVEELDRLSEETKDFKFKQFASEALEESKKKKGIAKSISKIVQSLCPTCHKPAVIRSSFSDNKNFYHQLACGHLIVEKKAEVKSLATTFKSVEGDKLYKFQLENVDKFRESGGKLCIFDEMGLGKTPSSIAIAHTYNLFPVAVFCKSGLKHQWKRMIEFWGNEFDEFGIPNIQAQVIDSSKSVPLLGMHFYIASLDLLPLLKSDFFQRAKDSKMRDLPLNIRLAIVDECQAIKNPETDRTRAVFRICSTIPNIIFTSGTPIKNSGIEFYPVLHMCDPIKFPNREKFARDWVDTYMSGQYLKYGGIRNYEKFSQETERYIIRHTQKEVLPDLPEITRNFRYIELDEQKSGEYANVAKEFADYYYKTSKEDRQFFQNILAFLVEMRHITGRAKIEDTVDFAIEFLESTERKLTIFTHHIDVREKIVEKLNAYLLEKEMKPCLELVGNMDGEEREELKQKFNFDPSYRILVASTLASGEGHNLQHDCSDCVMMERQWNPSNEEQAEFRFKRPGQKSSVINATYMLAEETIDEYLTKLVENKRMLVKHALDGTKAEWNQNAILMELAGIIASREGRKLTK